MNILNHISVSRRSDLFIAAFALGALVVAGIAGRNYWLFAIAILFSVWTYFVFRNEFKRTRFKKIFHVKDKRKNDIWIELTREYPPSFLVPESLSRIFSYDGTFKKETWEWLKANVRGQLHWMYYDHAGLAYDGTVLHQTTVLFRFSRADDAVNFRLKWL